MKCPRCKSETVELLTKAPKDNAWEVYVCKTCCYSFRSTEDASVTDPEKYDPRFYIDPKDIPNLLQIPPVAKKKD